MNLEGAGKLTLLYINNDTRIEKDITPIKRFLLRVLPIIREEWPAVGPAVNDLIPILEEAAKDL